jgi:cytochrome P450
MAATDVRSLDQELARPRLVDDPYPVYARLRAQDPVHWCQPWRQWVLTRYDDVEKVTRDPRRFSSEGWEASYLRKLAPDVRARLPYLERHYSAHVLSNTDPPAHNRLRRVVVRSFTPRVLEAIQPDVERLVDRLLDRIDRPGAVDFVAEFAYPLPAIVIAQLLGAPEDGREQFERWSADLVAFVGSGQPLPERAMRADASLRDFRAYLEPLIETAGTRPSDDLISLLATPGEDGERLTPDELVATCVTLLFAGHETTANLIANGLLALLRHPEELKRLKYEPVLAVSAVEELLRYDSPVQRLRRRATEDVELRGELIRSGDLVMAFNGAANRDPERFLDPDRLDITRGDTGHLAFGHGIHFCVGAALTRLEAPIALNRLLRRFPRLRLAPNAQIRWKSNITFRGLESLPLELR